MATAPFCVVARERASNIAVLPEKSGQNLGNLFPRRFRPAGAGVAVSSPFPTDLLKKIMAPISEIVDAVERSLRSSREDALIFVADLIKVTDIRVEFDDQGKWITITADQREKTRVEDGRVITGVDAEIVRLSFITPGFDAESESSHPDRVSAPTKTTPKPGREPIISSHHVYEAVERCQRAGGNMAGNARSPARLRAGPKHKFDPREIDLEIGLSLYFDGPPPDYNINELCRRVWKRLEAKYGYSPDEMPKDTEMKKRCGVWMRALLDEIEGGGS